MAWITTAITTELQWACLGFKLKEDKEPKNLREVICQICSKRFWSMAPTLLIFKRIKYPGKRWGKRSNCPDDVPGVHKISLKFKKYITKANSEIS